MIHFGPFNAIRIFSRIEAFVRAPAVVADESGYARPIHCRHRCRERGIKPFWRVAFRSERPEEFRQGWHVVLVETKADVRKKFLVAVWQWPWATVSPSELNGIFGDCPFAFAEMPTGVKLQCSVLKCVIDGWIIFSAGGYAQETPGLISRTFDIAIVH